MGERSYELPQGIGEAPDTYRSFRCKVYRKQNDPQSPRIRCHVTYENGVPFADYGSHLMRVWPNDGKLKDTFYVDLEFTDEFDEVLSAIKNQNIRVNVRLSFNYRAGSEDAND